VDEHEMAGRVAVITGGARGFGKAFGHGLARQGAHAVLVDVDGATCEMAAAEIRDSGGAASAFVADVVDEQQVAALVDDVVDRFGGIDILINNAGLHSAAYSRPMAEMGLAQVRRLFDVNVMGTITCTLAAQQHMAGRPGACIVNISSTAAYNPGVAYGVSKLAVRGLTMASARELGPLGIRVNAVAPGLILTETIRTELPEETVRNVMAQQYFRSEGEEQDIVDAVLFLCSQNARFITGETLRVSAGFGLCIG
jgi:3-oxoacyl-[acyl-carrier protein] reductase